jgi:hypothetical protein
MCVDLTVLCIISSTKPHRFITHSILVYKLSEITLNMRKLRIFAIFTVIIGSTQPRECN